MKYIHLSRIIIRAWISYIKEKLGLISEDRIQLAKDRMAICDSCPSQIKRPVKVCGECGCVLVAKTRSLESECPKNSWLPKLYIIAGDEVIMVEEIPSLLKHRFLNWCFNKEINIEDGLVKEKYWERFKNELEVNGRY